MNNSVLSYRVDTLHRVSKKKRAPLIFYNLKKLEPIFVMFWQTMLKVLLSECMQNLHLTLVVILPYLGIHKEPNGHAVLLPGCVKRSTTFRRLFAN